MHGTIHNLTEARRFLSALGGDSAFTFQLFVDGKPSSPSEREQIKRLASIKHGTLEQLADDLVRLNVLPKPEHPRGVYVTVNCTDGMGRTTKNIVAVRAVFVDLDGAPIEPVMKSPLPPSIVVQSSKGKYHAYWLVHDIALADFSAFQKMLAGRFDGDPSVHDLPRVLRVPGFLHNKGEPFMSELVVCEPERRYSRSDIVTAFGEPQSASTKKQAGDFATLPPSVGRAKAIELAGIAVQRVMRDPSRGRHREGLWLGWEAKRQHLSREEAKFAAASYFELLPDTGSEGEAKPLSVKEVTASVVNAYNGEKEPNRSKTLVDFIYTGSQIMDLVVPPRATIVEPFVTEKSLTMVWAKRGVGKTWFSLQLAYSCATGAKFLAWNVTKPRRVLYIDGEMPLADLTQRIKQVSGEEVPENFMVLPSERLFLDDGPLRLNKEEDQTRVIQALDDLDAQGKKPDVLVFDNLSSLIAGMDENSNSDLDTFLTWLIQLRHRGHAIVLVHHAGKNGTQRGASRREDLLDTSIKLEELPAEARGNAVGAGFTVSFEKVRGKRPSPDTLNAQLIEDASGQLQWALGQGQALSKEMEALTELYAHPPSTQAELAIRMQVSEPRISELTSKLRNKGYLEKKGLRLTAPGRELAVRLGADQLPT